MTGPDPDDLHDDDPGTTPWLDGLNNTPNGNRTDMLDALAALPDTAQTLPDSKALVAVGDPLWDAKVRDILGQVHYYSTTRDGVRTAPEVLRMITLDAAGRLQALVAEAEARIGFVPPRARRELR